MKRTLSLVLTGVLLCSGCSSAYNGGVTANNATIGNGNQTTVATRSNGQSAPESDSYAEFTRQIILHYGNY